MVSIDSTGGWTDSLFVVSSVVASETGVAGAVVAGDEVAIGLFSDST